jgi:bifunctional non-homologous end joining protein LigD
MSRDLLHLDCKDLRKLLCRGRRERLAALLVGRSGGPIQFSEHVVGNGASFYAHTCQLGLEGMVSKRADAPYRSGRTEAWVKWQSGIGAPVVAGIQRKRGKPSYAVTASLDGGRCVGSTFIVLPQGHNSVHLEKRPQRQADSFHQTRR